VSNIFFGKTKKEGRAICCRRGKTKDNGQFETKNSSLAVNRKQKQFASGYKTNTTFAGCFIKNKK